MTTRRQREHPLSNEEFRRLLEFRTALRKFDRWSEAQAAQVHLTHAQHQLLLAIRGHADPRGPSIGEVAGYLLLRHHSVVELVDRAAAGGLVQRVRDEDDARLVRLRLTDSAEEKLRLLTQLHIAELGRLAPVLDRLTRGIEEPSAE
ncbi:MAG: MarR family winged helix-turn-helix transcriptional regulator [Mycobacteriales bacterium]